MLGRFSRELEKRVTVVGTVETYSNVKINEYLSLIQRE